METPFELGEVVTLDTGRALDLEVKDEIIDKLEGKELVVSGFVFPMVVVFVPPGDYAQVLPDILVSNEGFNIPDEPNRVPMTAKDVIHEVAGTLADRGKTRDDGQERSMGRAVAAFNAMTDHDLTEEEGWLFMQYLKDSRSRTGDYNFDDYLDKAGYAVLAAECADREAHS